MPVFNYGNYITMGNDRVIMMTDLVADWDDWLCFENRIIVMLPLLLKVQKLVKN